MTSSKTKQFEKLTPVKNIENMSVYQEALDFAFNESDLLNIAITGPYSAGKSSVISTYEEENNSKKFMYVSLAHFDDTNDDNGNIDKNKNNKNKIELEGKILNQIIHQIKPKNIPQTNFKIKSDVSYRKVLLFTLFISIILFTTIYLLFFNKWSAHVNGLVDGYIKGILLSTISSGFYLYSLITFGLLFVIGLFYIIKTQLERPFLKKIKLEKYEIEIFEGEKDSSHFDKHLDDILYLFRNSNVDAFVFEDIDRYNMNIIFTKLREINILINKSSTKRIRFIYLLRDDIFSSKDRTKFFDFIIPIVPIIDSSNSFDKIIEIFQKGGVLNSFDPTFLERLSLYIDDMRILKNVYNEYVIYHESIKGTELQNEKLLALITYKNLFPKDFSSLQYNKGYVYETFAKKEAIIKKKKDELNSKLEDNALLMEKIENDTLNGIEELDALYFRYDNGHLRIGNQYEYDMANHLEFIRGLKGNNKNIRNSHGYGVDMQEELKKLENIPEYVKRKKILVHKNENGISRIREENENIRKELKRVNSYKLKDLISKENIMEVFYGEKNEVTDSPYFELIIYLVRNGYIDETYSDYLTYFWGKDLTRIDKIFLRSITDEKKKEFDYRLEKVERVTARLKDSDFEQEEILNFHLLDYVLETDHRFLELMLENIKLNKRFDFIFDYVEWSANIAKFVRELNKSWPSLWNELIDKTNITRVQKKTYLIETMYHSAIEEILALNKNGSLTNYISASNDFLEIENPNIKLIILSLEALQVKFQSIDYQRSNKELFKEVYNHNLYEINILMLELLLIEVYQEGDLQKIKKENYTVISSFPNEPLKLYIDQNIDEYLALILENNEGEIDDSEEVVKFILNNKDIKEENKKVYATRSSITLTSIKEIPDNLWEYVILQNKLKHSVENMLDYYTIYAGEIDSTLIYFLNSSEGQEFDFSCVKGNYDEDDIIGFFKKVKETNGLSNTVYKEILKGSNLILEEFDCNEIEEEKVEILINLGIIKMNEVNLSFIRKEFANQAIIFICKNMDQYSQLLADEAIEKDEDEILRLIGMASISIELRLGFLKYYTSAINLQSKDYPMQINEYIIRHNFDDDDLEFIINNYHSFSLSFQRAVEDTVVNHIKKVIDYEIKIENDQLLTKVLEREEVLLLNKKKLLIFYFDNNPLLFEEEVIGYLSISGLNEFLPLFDGKRPKIKKGEINHRLLTYFEKKGWISSFNDDPNDSDFYRANGKLKSGVR